jgi:hypothetical protein
VTSDEDLELEIPPLRPRGTPTQPPGRTPDRRRPQPRGRFGDN